MSRHQVYTLRCPDCGGSVDESDKYCRFCGSRIFHDDGIIRTETVIRTTDEAAVKKIELQQEEARRKAVRQERIDEEDRKYAPLYIAILITIIVLAIIKFRS